MSRILDRPDLNIFIFAFFLNYPWENLQAPLYEGMKSAAHWDAVKACTQASLGDAAIMLLAYLGVAGAMRDRWWFRSSSYRPIARFVCLGVIITILIEYLATTSVDPNWGWRYADSMPVLPFIGLGLTPLLQWLVIPPITIWFVRRQLATVHPDYEQSLAKSYRGSRSVNGTVNPTVPETALIRIRDARRASSAPHSSGALRYHSRRRPGVRAFGRTSSKLAYLAPIRDQLLEPEIPDLALHSSAGRAIYIERSCASLPTGLSPV